MRERVSERVRERVRERVSEREGPFLPIHFHEAKAVIEAFQPFGTFRSDQIEQNPPCLLKALHVPGSAEAGRRRGTQQLAR